MPPQAGLLRRRDMAGSDEWEREPSQKVISNGGGLETVLNPCTPRQVLDEIDHAAAAFHFLPDT